MCIPIFALLLIDSLIQVMDENCARGFVDDDFIKYNLEAWRSGDAAGIADAWLWGVHYTYTNKANIPKNAHWSWNASTVNDILARNPSSSLPSADQWILPTNGDRPFPVVGSSLMGPTLLEPYENHTTLNTSMFEWTPLYFGQVWFGIRSNS